MVGQRRGGWYLGVFASTFFFLGLIGSIRSADALVSADLAIDPIVSVLGTFSSASMPATEAIHDAFTGSVKCPVRPERTIDPIAGPMERQAISCSRDPLDRSTLDRPSAVITRLLAVAVLRV